jgi:hypothetical protein
VVLSELGVIPWVRRKYMDTPWFSTIIQVVLGGLLVLESAFSSELPDSWKRAIDRRVTFFLTERQSVGF